MKNLIRIFKALSDKNRLRILLMLSRKPLCVCEIQDILQVTVSTVSKHLSILRDIGFITDEKEGKWVIYTINSSTGNVILQQILFVLPLWLNDDALIKSDLEKLQVVNRNVLCGN
jgi:ArsR family transcriptional regulator, arsenate/arsenite/antimonite-responsive transcriptional repressor